MTSNAERLRKLLEDVSPRQLNVIQTSAENCDCKYKLLEPEKGNAQSRHLPSQEEAVSIIQHQSAYIVQLEKELQLCQGELNTYKLQLNDVLDENTRIISSQQASEIFKEVIEHAGAKESQDSMSKKSLMKHVSDLELIKKLHASKASLLEQQLQTAKEDLAKSERKAQDFQSKLHKYESLASYDITGHQSFGGLCIRCGQNEALIAAGQSSSSLIGQLYNEKGELIQTLANVKSQLSEMQLRESEAIAQVKAGIEITEIANLEKAQALLDRERMYEELCSLKQKFENLMNHHSTALQEARNTARSEVRQEVGELERRLRAAVEQEAYLKTQVEKLSREKEDFMAEARRCQLELSVNQNNVVESSTGRRIDITQLGYERDMAMEEKNKLKNRILKLEQMNDEAMLRVKQELEDVRSRLSKAEHNLISSKEENIKVIKENQELEKQLNKVTSAYNLTNRSRNGELESLSKKLSQREEELQKTISDTESCYSKRLMELESIYEAQNNIVRKLREECESQAASIKQLSSKYKTENKKVKHENQLLKHQLEKSRENLATMDSHEVEHEKTHKKLRNRLTQLDDENRSLLSKANALTAECSEYQREIELLKSELRFYKCQNEPTSRANAGNGSNRSMVDDVLQALKSEITAQDEQLASSIKLLRDARAVTD